MNNEAIDVGSMTAYLYCKYKNISVPTFTFFFKIDWVAFFSAPWFRRRLISGMVIGAPV